MWGTFAIAVLVGAAFLFLPGFLLFRAVRMPYYHALSLAPLATVACYAVLCAGYGMGGITCSWVSVFFPAFLAGLALAAIGWALSRRHGSNVQSVPGAHVDAGSGVEHARGGTRNARGAFSRRDAAALVVFLGAGILVTLYAYVGQLAAPDAFIESWDNVHHLDKVRGFVDSGRWSSLGTSLYLGQDALIDPFVEGAFYPSAWHAFAAMIASALGVSAPLAVNAANFVITAFVFPLGIGALLRLLFGDALSVAVGGALVALANASSVWIMLTWGPLYPNIMANCFLPAFMAAFVLLFEGGSSRRDRIGAVLALLFGAVSFVFVQPNGAFSALVLLSPYVVVRAYSIAKKLVGRKVPASEGASVPIYARLVPLAVAMLVALAIVGIWAYAYNAPFMQAVVQYRWPVTTELADAFMDVATQRFHTAGLAIGCSVLLACGIVAVFVRRRHRWLVASWVLSCAIYIVCVAVPGEWHQIMAGFWYTDIPRVASLAVLAGVPLQAYGFSELLHAVEQPFAKHDAAAKAISVSMVAIMALLLYAPVDETESNKVGGRTFTNGNALMFEARYISSEYSFEDPRVYDEAERAFVAEAMALMPEDTLVVNEPNDGSAYAYGVDGLRTYYRYWRGYGSTAEGEKPESALIRGHLCDIAKDEEVADAVRAVGVRYVLQLEQGERDWNHTMWVYGDGQLWRGIDAIDENTPGFELVLSRDDMRLFEIVADERADT